MQWNKAGRPPLNKPLEEKQVRYDSKYTQRELIIAKNPVDGIKMLVNAIIDQWKADGCPMDADIDTWIRLKEELDEQG